LGNLKIITVASLVEAIHDTDLILHFAILAHLPLAFEPRDSKSKSNNAAQHDFDVGSGRIRWHPCLGFAAFLLSGKLG
jgi:hypothetical protein